MDVMGLAAVGEISNRGGWEGRHPRVPGMNGATAAPARGANNAVRLSRSTFSRPSIIAAHDTTRFEESHSVYGIGHPRNDAARTRARRYQSLPGISRFRGAP